MRITKYALSILTLISSAGIALAHGPGGGTTSYEGKSQGIQLNIAPTHHEAAVYQAQPGMEMSVEGQTIILNISDASGKPIDTEFAYAKTFIITGGKISELNLWPEGDNILSGTGDFNPDPDLRVEVRLYLPDREPVHKDFYPLR